MVQKDFSLHVNPGKSLGFLVLGSALQDVLTRLLAHSKLFPAINVAYSYEEPLIAPVIVTLPRNGLRLRFDGPGQRLRLIEVLDFSMVRLMYKNNDLLKAPKAGETAYTETGPLFARIYKDLFGPTFPGEYLPSVEAYVLSYPGLAFSFPLPASSWSPKANFVALLSSSNALAARSLAIFNGPTWKDARKDLFTGPYLHPRIVAGRGREGVVPPVEVDSIRIRKQGEVEVLRRSLPTYTIVLGETTPQDLVAVLGPPDAIYRKYDRKLSIHKRRTTSRSERPRLSVSPGGQTSDTDHSNAITDDSDPEDDGRNMASHKERWTESFYNYFQHGFDIFVSLPLQVPDGAVPVRHFVVTKILLHANVPGSHSFNRYRRCRWTLDLQSMHGHGAALNSESPFSKIASPLRRIFTTACASADERKAMEKPMLLNRSWNDSPGSSIELLGDLDDEDEAPKKTGSGMGNTAMYGFPGLLFEVLKNDAVSCLTVYR